MKKKARLTRPMHFALITVCGMTITIGGSALAGQTGSMNPHQQSGMNSSAPQAIQQPYHSMARSGPNQYQSLYPEQQEQQGMQNQPRYYSQQNRQSQDQQQQYLPLYRTYDQQRLNNVLSQSQNRQFQGNRQSQYQSLYPENQQQMGMQQGQQGQRRYYSQSPQNRQFQGDQQSRYQPLYPENQQQMGMQQGQQGQRRYYSQSQQGQQQTGSAQWQLDPMGWVNLGYDYDNDGTFDAFELITVYDLQRMKSSQQAGSNTGQQGDRFATAGQQRQGMVEGTIVETRTAQIANTGQQHMIAKVKNQFGTAKIDLGPKQDLADISMQQGDHIKVFGVEGSINDNFILLADRLQVNGQRVKINRQDSQPLKKIQATVLNTRTVSKDQHSNLMARLELQDGTRTIANFGPKEQLPQISHGQQVQLLARVTEIGGRKALIADRLRTQGETYRIDWDAVQKGSRQ